MAKYRGVARDEFGNALSSASVTVYDFGTTTESSIYSESTLTTAESNPLSTGDDGVYTFYAAPGYYDVQVAKSGYSTVTLENEILGTVMAVAKGDDNGQKASAGSTPNIIGNTNLGATHLVSQYESGFTIDVDAGTFTYDGEETIIVEVIAKIVYTTSVAATMITRAYRDKGGSRELIVAVGNTLTDVSPNLGTTVYGVCELDPGETIGFYFSVGVGSATVDTHNGSFYSVKRLG